MGYTSKSDMMSLWRKFCKIGWYTRCSAVALLGSVLLSGCAKQPVVHYSQPTLQQLRHWNSIALDRAGAQVVQQGQTLKIYLPIDQLFSPRSANLTASAYLLLDRVAALLPLYETESIQVAGYSDNLGSHGFLTLLTRRQAEQVANYLWPNKMDAAMVYAQGNAAKNPIASNASAGGQATNRRIVITLRFYPVIKRYN